MTANDHYYKTYTATNTDNFYTTNMSEPLKQARDDFFKQWLIKAIEAGYLDNSIRCRFRDVFKKEIKDLLFKEMDHEFIMRYTKEIKEEVKQEYRDILRKRIEKLL